MYLLIQGNDIKEAFDNTNTALNNTMGDYTIAAISESPIMDVFPYFENDEEGVEKLERFNAIKATTKSIIADSEDPMEFEDVEEGAEV